MVLLDEIKKLDSRLNSVNDLLAIGHMVHKNNKVLMPMEGIEFRTIVDEPGYQMGIAIFEHIGSETPDHQHVGVQQIIVQTKGRTAGFFEGGGYRILDVGSVCVLAPNEIHRFVALSENAEQAWICIPAEEGYRIRLNGVV